MTTTHFPSRIRRRSVPSDNTPLVRQWQLLQWLSSEATGMDQKTIRRDLVLLRRIGFDLEELVEEHGRKRWRIRHPFERLRSKRRRYQAIGEGLDQLLAQVEKVGDKRLLKDLKRIEQRVKRKGG